jgi:anti-sigma regulatory factor (Ser/Thr protein kinase)
MKREERGRGPRMVLIDLDPPWRETIIAAAARAGAAVAAVVTDPMRATTAVSTPLDVVLWNLASIDGFDFALAAMLGAAFPHAECLVAVGDAPEEAVVRLLQAGVTYLCDKRDGPEALGTSLAAVLRFDAAVRGVGPGLRVEYPAQNWVEIAAPSEQKFVESVARFAAALTRTRLPERKRRSLAYALREIGQNAVEWGNAFDPSKRVRVSFCILEDRVLVKFEDEGAGFDRGALLDVRDDPLGALVRRAGQGKRIGGYGIAIVTGLMDEVIFSERGNAVVLVLRLDDPALDPPPGSSRP